MKQENDIPLLTAGPSGPGGPSISIPCKNQNKVKMVLRRTRRTDKRGLNKGEKKYKLLYVLFVCDDP